MRKSRFYRISHVVSRQMYGNMICHLADQLKKKNKNQPNKNEMMQTIAADSKDNECLHG